MEALDQEQIDQKKRTYFREYMKVYRIYNDRSFSDWKTRQNVDYREREKLRMKNRRNRVREFKMFQNAMPHFLTV